MKNDATYRPIVLLVIGVILIGFAWLVENPDIERALVSDPARSLEWGPTLFRAVLAFHGLALVLTATIWRKRVLAAGHLPAPSAEAEPDGSQSTGKTCWLALFGLSALALGLRLWNLNSDLWYDEVLTLLDFVRPPLGDIVTSFPSQNQHMLYSVLAHISINIFGESAWAVRLPSVVFGVASLWALFLLGRRIIGAREALLACALMTVSYHHIWFSQNARGYMGLMFFSTVATWLWLEARERDGWAWWIGYAVALALGMWVHMTMAFVAAAHGLVYLFGAARDRKIHWKLIAAWLLFASLTIQLHALSLPEFLRVALHEVSVESEWTNPLWVVSESLRSLRIGFSGIAVLLCGAAMVGAGWFSMVRKNSRAGLLMVLPALLAGTAMLLLGHNLWPRFFFFSIGFALLIAVHGAVMMPRLLFASIKPLQAREGLGLGAGLALVSLLIFASMLTVPRCYALPKQDFTGARDFVENHRRQGDAVVSVGLAGGAYRRYFAQHWLVAETEAELAAIQNEHEMVWLVYTIPIQVKAYCPDIWDEVERGYQVVKVFPGTLGGGEVYVCQKRQSTDLSKK
jgi:4-amino-4-deoxy-L-arabinose transferase-like glycosyltransferase